MSAKRRNCLLMMAVKARKYEEEDVNALSILRESVAREHKILWEVWNTCNTITTATLPAHPA